MTDENNPQVTYRTDNGSYDVLQLSQDAQGLFNVIVECTNEVNNLRRRIAVLDAAVQNFNGQMQEHLTDDALIEEDTQEEASVEEDS